MNTKMAPERFIQGEISAIVRQIHAPRTGRPEAEIPALVAELCVWMEHARRIERVEQDWTATE